jgi:hypothetical protein
LANSFALSFGVAFAGLVDALAPFAATLVTGFAGDFLLMAFADLALALLADLAGVLLAFLASTLVDLVFGISFTFFATGLAGAFALPTGFALLPFLLAVTLEAGFFIVIFAMDQSYKLVITYI